MHPITQTTLDFIAGKVAEFERTGIFMDARHTEYGKWEDYPPGASHALIRKLARKVASASKRPFITASRYYYNDDEHFSAHVLIPRRKSLAPLMAPLLMVGEHQPLASPSSVWIYHMHGYIKFGFRRSEGRRIWDKWLADTQVRPEWRKALHLPPLEDSGTALAA